MDSCVSTLICGEHRLSLDVPRVMGIANLTPDSFYAGSRLESGCALLERVEQMVLAGVDIVDLGGYSTRPGAEPVSVEEELSRLKPAMHTLTRNFPQLMISVDTFRAEVVQHLYEYDGPFIVNDVTAGEADVQMVPLVARLSLPYIAMHMRGTPQTMSQLAHYDNVVDEVQTYLREKINALRMAGIQQVILDPGFGFAKTTEQNYQLFNALESFHALGAPILVGISRKGMVWKPLDLQPATALVATSVLHLQALLHGANILRVHDVAEAKQIITLMRLLKTC